MDIALVKSKFPHYRIIEAERGFIIYPPDDTPSTHRIPLEIPRVHNFKESDGQAIDYFTRAIPDYDYLLATYYNLKDFESEQSSRIMFCARFGTFMRFGTTCTSEECGGELVFKILPPEYSMDMEVIIQMRSGDDYQGLAKYLKAHYTNISYLRIASNKPFAYIVFVAPITEDMANIRDSMSGYWGRITNSSVPMSREEKRDYNLWLNGTNFI